MARGSELVPTGGKKRTTKAMSKITAPLLSFGAGGQIAKTQVYSKWRGVPYVRRYVVPANPNSTSQQSTRNTFAFLMALWKLMDSDAQAPWTAYANGKPLTNRNAITKFNLPVLRTATDVSGFIGSPGANGGLPAAGLVLTPGAGTIDAAMTAPTLPTGWSITNAVALAMINGDPHTTTDFATFVATDNSTPYAPSFTSLAAGEYVVCVWFVYAKPDASVAYGPAISSTTTVT